MTVVKVPISTDAAAANDGRLARHRAAAARTFDLMIGSLRWQRACPQSSVESKERARQKESANVAESV